MKIIANSPEDYINQLTADQKEAIEMLRKTILEHIPKGFTEIMQYNMISYTVPKSLYPSGYHCDPALDLPFISIAAQKKFIALYHLGIYANASLLEWFVKEYALACTKKLDMGKSCIRFKKSKDIPYALIAQLVQKMTVVEWIEIYEKNKKISS